MAEHAMRTELMEEWSERFVDLLSNSPLTVGETRALVMSLAISYVASTVTTVEEAELHFDEAKRETRANWLLPVLCDNRAQLINAALDQAEEARRP